MSPSLFPGSAVSMSAATSIEPSRSGAASGDADIKLRFEQMLWAEMLNHAGLEKALTLGGGEAASAFSRYVVEDIARDLAEKHPLGLADRASAPVPGPYATVEEPPG